MDRRLVVLRLDDNGSPLWAFRAGGTEDDHARGLIADSNGSLNRLHSGDC